MFNPIIRGWIAYYGRYTRSALYRVMRHIDHHLWKWVREKYRRLRRHRQQAWQWIDAVRARDSKVLAHWHLLPRATAG